MLAVKDTFAAPRLRGNRIHEFASIWTHPGRHLLDASRLRRRRERAKSVALHASHPESEADRSRRRRSTSSAQRSDHRHVARARAVREQGSERSAWLRRPMRRANCAKKKHRQHLHRAQPRRDGILQSALQEPRRRTRDPGVSLRADHEVAAETRGARVGTRRRTRRLGHRDVPVHS